MYSIEYLIGKGVVKRRRSLPLVRGSGVQGFWCACRLTQKRSEALSVCAGGGRVERRLGEKPHHPWGSPADARAGARRACRRAEARTRLGNACCVREPKAR